MKRRGGILTPPSVSSSTEPSQIFTYFADTKNTPHCGYYKIGILYTDRNLIGGCL
jgi:glutaredoxin-related protein